MLTVMLLIHLLLNSGCVECTSYEFFLRLFRNYVYYHFISSKINKRGGGNKRGWKIFQKLISRGIILQCILQIILPAKK